MTYFSLHNANVIFIRVGTLYYNAIGLDIGEIFFALTG